MRYLGALLQQEEKEAHHVATALEIYVKGSLNLFNHRTNVNVNNRIVCYDIKELGKQMKKLGMLIVQDQVWGRVTANRSSGKSTRYYMDSIGAILLCRDVTELRRREQELQTKDATISEIHHRVKNNLHHTASLCTSL